MAFVRNCRGHLYIIGQLLSRERESLDSAKVPADYKTARSSKIFPEGLQRSSQLNVGFKLNPKPELERFLLSIIIKCH